VRIKLYRGKYYAVYRDGGETRRVSLRTDDLATAQRRLADLRRRPVGETVADHVEAYLASKIAAASHEAMRYSWKALKPHFGQFRPDQITPEMCKAYAKARKVKPGTVRKDLGFLRTALKGRGGQFWLPQEPPPRDRFLTKAEFARLMAAPSPAHLKLFLVLALTTGGRSGALLELTWDRVDFARGQIRLAEAREGQGRQKGRATVPMNQSARTALEEAARARTTEWVIEWAGRRVKSVKRAFREACAAAGLQEVTPHVIRHTAAVWMIEAGASITEVSQYLGHTDTRTTFRVYARHSPDHLRSVAAALEL
jgi:integrase